MVYMSHISSLKKHQNPLTVVWYWKAIFLWVPFFRKKSDHQYQLGVPPSFANTLRMGTVEDVLKTHLTGWGPVATCMVAEPPPRSSENKTRCSPKKLKHGYRSSRKKCLFATLVCRNSEKSSIRTKPATNSLVDTGLPDLRAWKVVG